MHLSLSNVDFDKANTSGVHICDHAIFESWVLQLFKKKMESKSWEFWKRQDNKDSSKLELFVSVHNKQAKWNGPSA